MPIFRLRASQLESDGKTVKNPMAFDREIEAPDEKTALKHAVDSLIENPGTSRGDIVWLAEESGKMIRIFHSGMGKSIFPTFDVNVPMPKDTAVPGSYYKSTQQPSSGTAASKPAEAAE